jgi:hypothetical protein
MGWTAGVDSWQSPIAVDRIKVYELFIYIKGQT